MRPDGKRVLTFEISFQLRQNEGVNAFEIRVGKPELYSEFVSYFAQAVE